VTLLTGAVARNGQIADDRLAGVGWPPVGRSRCHHGAVSGRKWLFIGAILGVAIAFGHVPYLAGAARDLAETALRVVASGGAHVVSGLAHTGAPKRVVLGISALVSVLAPGVTALLLVLAARGTLRLRAVIGLLLALLGAATFFYESNGHATGALLLALAVAGIAVLATGPLVAAPLAALAALITSTYLPRLLWHRNAIEGPAVRALHTALYARPGDPDGLQVALVVVAIVPFAFALRSLLRR
jgi:hypothetical protein